jgi:hypothetical protein
MSPKASGCWHYVATKLRSAMEVDSDRDWIVVEWCWFVHKTTHPTTSISSGAAAQIARGSRRDEAFMSADPLSTPASFRGLDQPFPDPFPCCLSQLNSSKK